MNRIKGVAIALAAGVAAFGMAAASAEPTEGRWAYCYVQHGAMGDQFTISKLFRPMAEPGWFDSKGSGALANVADEFKAAVAANQTGRTGSHELTTSVCETDASFYALSDRRGVKMKLRSTRMIEWPTANAILVASPATAAPLAVAASENAQHLLAYTLGQFRAGERTHEFMSPELKAGLDKTAPAVARSAGEVQEIKLLRAEPDGHVFEVKHANGVLHWKVGQKSLFLTHISHAQAGR